MLLFHTAMSDNPYMDACSNIGLVQNPYTDACSSSELSQNLKRSKDVHFEVLQLISDDRVMPKALLLEYFACMDRLIDDHERVLREVEATRVEASTVEATTTRVETDK